ncbi:hypothetical protein GmHk_12G035160 [Glycine max]|nr:hypothetical protein GmHk_12G035160 [Glycine max]
MDRFNRIVVQIRNLNPKVALHPMLLALRLDKSADSLCKKSPSNMNELRERAKSARTDTHKSDKRHKPDKHQPIPIRPKYERYTPLITNQATILEEVFNVEIPIQLPPIPPPRPGLDKTKNYRYHHNYGHNTEDCWALKDKMEKLIQVGYLA